MYCVNCKHHIFVAGDSEHGSYDRCGRIKTVSWVTGKPVGIKELPYCEIERKESQACKPEGLFFEAKDKLLSLIHI